MKGFWPNYNKEKTTTPQSNSIDIAKDAGVDNLHKRERDEFLKLLSQTGEKMPPGGDKVLDGFLLTEGHISPDYLQKQIEGRGQVVDMDTINNTLDILCRYGMAQRVQLNGTGPWYEHLHLGADHDHLLCTKCGRIIEFKDQILKTKIQKAAFDYKFEPLIHKLTVLGLCPSCRIREEPVMPLALAARGEKVNVIRFAGGRKMQNRLASMGLTSGDVIEVLNNTGPFIINVKGTRLALGMGLAQKVLVTHSK